MTCWNNYDPTTAGRKIESFVNDLSNWYVRRSRRRFWKSQNDDDKLSAYNTLYHTLVTLSKLLAPFAPFVAEEMYQNLVCTADKDAAESVHLAAFPMADMDTIDKGYYGRHRVGYESMQYGKGSQVQERSEGQTTVTEGSY